MNDRLEQAWTTRTEHFPMVIEFDYPLDTAVVSLTGEQCALNCAHCAGHYLKQMQPIWKVQAGEAKSCLISGGCDPQGRVPVGAHLDAIAALRAGRMMNWHVGLISRPEIESIAPYVDLISFDFVGDDATIREVYGLEKTVEDYVATYRLLSEYVPVVPHLTIGLKGGEIAGERRVLEILSGLNVDTLVLLVLIPTPGTRYADRQPPSVEAVTELMIDARLALPRANLYLGCMRPHGEYRAAVDVMAVRAGVNKIVSPARETVRVAEDLGLRIERGRECCAVRPIAV